MDLPTSSGGSYPVLDALNERTVYYPHEAGGGSVLEASVVVRRTVEQRRLLTYLDSNALQLPPTDAGNLNEMLRRVKLKAAAAAFGGSSSLTRDEEFLSLRPLAPLTGDKLGVMAIPAA